MPTTPEPDRPQVPDSFGVGDPKHPFTPIHWDHVVQQLTDSRNYWIATTRPDQRPHSVPLWGAWVDHAFHFLTDPKSLTARNLAHNPHAAVHLESGDNVVILNGLFQQTPISPALINAFAHKYDFPIAQPDFPAYRLQLRKAMAWREHDFPSSATRWRFPNP